MNPIYHYDIKQKSSEWLDLRKGKITGTKGGAWLWEEPEPRQDKSTLVEILRELMAAQGNDLTPKQAKATNAELIEAIGIAGGVLEKTYTKSTQSARQTLVASLIAEAADCDRPPDKPTFWMLRGDELEPYARQSYQLLTGNVVHECGFIELEGLPIGCSPDGLVEDEGMIEAKCFEPGKHMLIWLEDQIPLDVFPQLHHNLAASARQWVDFVSYCPGTPTYIKRVHRNETTERYLAGLLETSRAFTAAQAKMAEEWERQMKKLNVDVEFPLS